MSEVKAIVCDTGGTVFDWFTPVCDALALAGVRHGVSADWAAVTRTWRMASTRLVDRGMPQHQDGRPWDMDDALDDTLDVALDEAGVVFPDEARGELVRAWRRMPAWPDVAPGVRRLRELVPVAPFTILRTALIVEASRLSGIVWDTVISCETFGIYKTQPDSYRWAARIFDVRREDLLIVTTHNNDLEAAADMGLRTAFIHRPDEWGGAPSDDPDPSPRADATVSAFGEVEALLGR